MVMNIRYRDRFFKLRKKKAVKNLASGGSFPFLRRAEIPHA